MTTAVLTTQTSDEAESSVVSETVISEPAAGLDANSIFRTAAAGVEIAPTPFEAEERVLGTSPHVAGEVAAPAPHLVASEMARRAEENPTAILSVVTVRPTLWERTASLRTWLQAQLVRAWGMLRERLKLPAPGARVKTLAKRVLLTSLVGGCLMAFAAVELNRATLRGELASSQAVVAELTVELEAARATIADLSAQLAEEVLQPWWRRLDRW